jgi:hypothetical protein
MKGGMNNNHTNNIYGATDSMSASHTNNQTAQGKSASQPGNVNKRTRKGAAKKRSQSCNTHPKMSHSQSQSQQQQASTFKGKLILSLMVVLAHEESKVMPNMNPEEPVYEEDAEVQVVAPNFRICNDD